VRKGRTYGTILIALATGRPVDVLADRTAETLAAWLLLHPGITLVSRDRAGAYADGIARGAPSAWQVADRFHVLVRRFTRHSIPVLDGKGYKGDLWVNDLPGGENQRGQEHVVRKWNGIEDV
jgi:hypothetical protein